MIDSCAGRKASDTRGSDPAEELFFGSRGIMQAAPMGRRSQRGQPEDNPSLPQREFQLCKVLTYHQGRSEFRYQDEDTTGCTKTLCIIV
jgi:hypothetical protein